MCIYKFCLLAYVREDASHVSSINNRNVLSCVNAVSSAEVSKHFFPLHEKREIKDFSLFNCSLFTLYESESVGRRKKLKMKMKFKSLKAKKV